MMEAAESLQDLKDLDVERAARAIEADAGCVLPGLRLSLEQAKAGVFAAIHTPEQITARRRGRPQGSTKAGTKEQTSIRLSPDVMAAFRASGRGWQSRMDVALKDWLRTHSPMEVALD